MKKKFLSLITLFALAFAVSSCRTALEITQQDVPALENNPVNAAKVGLIEFIGFKNSYTDQGATFFKTYPYFNAFGQLLEASNIAVNRSDFYTGVYSFQEFAMYKSTQRYISYVDVISHIDWYDDTYAIREGMVVAGVLLTLTGIGIPIGIPLWICANPNKSMLQIKGEYKLYVYDTKKQEIVYASPFVIDESDIFKGQYRKLKDYDLVKQRSRNIVSNAFLDAYNDASRFLENLND
ncbi:MAG: hypothetical protein LBM07_04010 [Culturomica sp.]|jgi:hypothetical protein|nr:hypothetical protein [Culturomica sp.]